MIAETILTFLFGTPQAIWYARVLSALAALCPCPPSDAACDAHHRRAAAAIAAVSAEDPDPEDAAARALGAGAHETRFATEYQEGDGPAVTYYQHEVHPSERAALLRDLHGATRRAIRIARLCGGSMEAYARGRCVPSAAAEELRQSVAAASRAIGR